MAVAAPFQAAMRQHAVLQSRKLLSPEAVGGDSRDSGQNPLQCHVEDDGKIRFAHQHALNLDTCAESVTLRAGMRDKPEKVAVGDFELHHFTRFEFLRQHDTQAGVGNIGQIAPVGSDRWNDRGDADINPHQGRLERQAVFRAAFHEVIIGKNLR